MSVEIVAELGDTHGGNFKTAVKLIKEAKKAGADTVKFQVYDLHELARKDTENFKALGNSWLSLHNHALLSKVAKEEGLGFLCSVFDEYLAQRLAELVGATRFKIASGDITHHGLIKTVAKLGSVILSTGAASFSEIMRAVEVAGNVPITLLHCVAAYPPPPDQMDMWDIRRLSDWFSKPVGFSDHSPSIVLPAVSVALGAVLIEKHMALSHKSGVHHVLDPKGFSEMVKHVRQAEAALGAIPNIGGEPKRIKPCEAMARVNGRRGLRATADLDVGTRITKKNAHLTRPLEHGAVGGDEAEKLFEANARVNVYMPCGHTIYTDEVEYE